MSERQAPTTTSPGAVQFRLNEHPLDSLLIPLKQWVEAREQERVLVQSELDNLPDDIPHFIMRSP